MQVLHLTVIISQDDYFRRRPIYTEIVRRAQAAGLAGATVVRGAEGFGASRRIRTSRLPGLAEHLPVVITIVDREDRIRAFLPQLSELVVSGLVTLDVVEVVGDGPSGERDAASPDGGPRSIG